MIRTDKAVVVEGKYDKIKLSSIIDAPIIVTNGFNIYKSRETAELIRFYADRTGIIILTDSDCAGFKIRNYIKGFVPGDKITNVYIPDIFGKESRKDKPSREGKLGVEGIDADIIINAFKKAGISADEAFPEKKGEKISRQDLFEAGLFGGSDSSKIRKKLISELGLPEHLSVSAFLEALNLMMTRKDFIDHLKQ